MLECQKDDQHDGREIMWDEDQISNDRIDEDQGSLIHPAGKRLSGTDRKCSDPSRFIVIMLIDMFSNVYTGHPQPVGNTRQDYVPDVAGISTFDQCHDQVNACYHNRTPDQENGKFTQSPIFERIGISQQDERAKSK